MFQSEKIIITSPTMVVIIKRKAVTKLKGKYCKACFPSTVELPQQKAARSANIAAIIVLLSQFLHYLN